MEGSNRNIKLNVMKSMATQRADPTPSQSTSEISLRKRFQGASGSPQAVKSSLTKNRSSNQRPDSTRLRRISTGQAHHVQTTSNPEEETEALEEMSVVAEATKLISPFEDVVIKHEKNHSREKQLVKLHKVDLSSDFEEITARFHQQHREMRQTSGPPKATLHQASSRPNLTRAVSKKMIQKSSPSLLKITSYNHSPPSHRTQSPLNLLVTSNSEEMLQTHTVGKTIMMIQGTSKQLTHINTINSRDSSKKKIKPKSSKSKESRESPREEQRSRGNDSPNASTVLEKRQEDAVGQQSLFHNEKIQKSSTGDPLDQNPLSASFKLTAQRIHQSTLNEGTSSPEEDSVTKDAPPKELVLFQMLQDPKIETTHHISVIPEPVAKVLPRSKESPKSKQVNLPNLPNIEDQPKEMDQVNQPSQPNYGNQPNFGNQPSLHPRFEPVPEANQKKAATFRTSEERVNRKVEILKKITKQQYGLKISGLQISKSPRRQETQKVSFARRWRRFPPNRDLSEVEDKKPSRLDILNISSSQPSKGDDLRLSLNYLAPTMGIDPTQVKENTSSFQESSNQMGTLEQISARQASMNLQEISQMVLNGEQQTQTVDASQSSSRIEHLHGQRTRQVQSQFEVMQKPQPTRVSRKRELEELHNQLAMAAKLQTPVHPRQRVRAQIQTNSHVLASEAALKQLASAGIQRISIETDETRIIEPNNVTTSFEPTETNVSPVACPSKLVGHQGPVDLDSLFIAGRNHHLVLKETSRISSQFTHNIKPQWLKADHNQSARMSTQRISFPIQIQKKSDQPSSGEKTLAVVGSKGKLLKKKDPRLPSIHINSVKQATPVVCQTDPREEANDDELVKIQDEVQPAAKLKAKLHTSTVSRSIVFPSGPSIFKEAEVSLEPSFSKATLKNQDSLAQLRMSRKQLQTLTSSKQPLPRRRKKEERSIEQVILEQNNSRLANPEMSKSHLISPKGLSALLEGSEEALNSTVSVFDIGQLGIQEQERAKRVFETQMRTQKSFIHTKYGSYEDSAYATRALPRNKTFAETTAIRTMGRNLDRLLNSLRQSKARQTFAGRINAAGGSSSSGSLSQERKNPIDISLSNISPDKRRVHPLDRSLIRDGSVSFILSGQGSQMSLQNSTRNTKLGSPMRTSKEEKMKPSPEGRSNYPMFKGNFSFKKTVRNLQMNDTMQPRSINLLLRRGITSGNDTVKQNVLQKRDSKEFSTSHHETSLTKGAPEYFKQTLTSEYSSSPKYASRAVLKIPNPVPDPSNKSNTYETLAQQSPHINMTFHSPFSPSSPSLRPMPMSTRPRNSPQFTASGNKVVLNPPRQEGIVLPIISHRKKKAAMRHTSNQHQQDNLDLSEILRGTPPQSSSCWMSKDQKLRNENQIVPPSSVSETDQ